MMNYNETESDRFLIASLEGRVDGVTAPQAQTKLLASVQKAAEKNEQLAIEMHGLDYLSSAGMRVLLLCIKESKKVGIHCCFVGLTPEIKEILDVTQCFTSVPTFETLEAAEHAEIK